MAYRTERVESIIRKELSNILLFEAHDAHLKYVSITKVSLNKDMSVALIWYTVMGTKEEIEATKAILEKSKGYLRSSIAKKLDLRKTPELRFKYDESLEYGAHIEEILNNINKNEEK